MAPPSQNRAAPVGVVICLLVMGTMGCAPAPLGAHTGGQCASDLDCNGGEAERRDYVCRHVDGVPTCVDRNYDPDRHRGCELCPDSCRNGDCIAPEDTGPVCEFDDECAGELCIGGQCGADPRGAPCETSVDCAVGLSCAGGACVSEFGEACVADADCGAEEICAGATCIPADDCAVTPDLRGEWTFSSTLSFDDALPPSTRALLDAVQAPLAFLTGDLPIDEPLLRVVATRLAAVIRDYARANLPDWFWPLLTFVGELDRALGTMEIRETVTLSPTEEMNHYRGPRRWEEVSVMIGGAEHQRRTEDIAGFGRDTSDTPVVALCGRFVMRRHAVEVGMGAVAAWAAKEAVRDATGGLFEIHEVVAAAARGFCQGVARATDGILPGDFQDMVEFACDSQIRRLSAALSDVLGESRMGTETMIVRGDGAIRSGNELSGGTWRATMAGSELSGDFVATR